MSAEHKRPLYAFAILLSVCALVVGHTLHTQALVRVIAATAPAAVTVAGEVFTSTPAPQPAEPPAAAEDPPLPAVRSEPVRTAEDGRAQPRPAEARPAEARPAKARAAKARLERAARSAGPPDVRPASSPQRRAAPGVGSPAAARVSQTAWHRSHGPRSHAQRSDRRSPRAQERANHASHRTSHRASHRASPRVHGKQARGHRGRAKAHQQRGSRGPQRSHGRGRGRG